MRIYVKPHVGVIDSPSGVVYTHADDTNVYAVVLNDTELPAPWELSTLEDLRAAGGSFSEDIFETTEQKLTRLEEQNLILMDALATTFEELLALRAIVEGGSS